MLKIANHPIYAHPLPAGHRFPMEKYTLLPAQLLHEGTVEEANFFTPEMPALESVLRAHSAQYVHNLQQLSIDAKMQRKIGFPLSKQLIDREFILAQGTIQAAHFALEFGCAMNIAGGTHHAFTDRGEAFCLLNDQAIAAHDLLAHKKAQQILVVDLDVHQGNGTSQIFQKEKRVFTFSMHGKSNYPFKKEVSDLDIALPDGMSDTAYLKILRKTLPALISRVQPDFIFYLSGVDVIASDKLGKLGLTVQGCKERDAFVLQTCKDLDLPVMCAMGGGYSPNIKTIVEAHANTYRLAQHIFF